MSHSGLKLPTRTEAEVRALAATKIRARDAYVAHLARNTNGLTEDQRIDLEIEGQRLWRAYDDAMLALSKATRT